MARKRKATARTVQRDRSGRFVSRKRVAREAPGETPRRVARRVREDASATRRIGAENLKRGSRRIGTTGRLTPTKRGFGALRGLFKELQSEGRRLESRGLYTLNVGIRYRDARGRFVTPPESPNVVVPDLETVKLHRKKHETVEQAFRRIMTDRVRSAIFRAAQNAPDIAPVAEKYEELQELLDAGDVPEARQKLREIKAARELTFKVSVNRVHD